MPDRLAVGSREGAGARASRRNLRLQLDEVVKERDANRGRRQSSLRSRPAQEERERSFEQQIEALKDAKESLSAQFHEIGDKLLGEARKSVPRTGRGEVHPGGAARSRPCSRRYQEKLQTVEKERVDHYAGLREAVELVRTGQGQVRDETRNLVNALRHRPRRAAAGASRA